MSVDAAVLAVHDDAEVLRVGHVLDEDLRAGAVGRPGRDLLAVRVLEDVVAEHDDQLVAVGELARHADDLRDPARLCLHLVGEVELEQRLVRAARADAAVAEQVDHLAGVRLAGHEQHLGHPGELEQLERVVDHRPAADRQQVLVGHAGQLAEPRRLAARRDQAFHLCPPPAHDPSPAVCGSVSPECWADAPRDTRRRVEPGAPGGRSAGRPALRAATAARARRATEPAASSSAEEGHRARHEDRPDDGHVDQDEEPVGRADREQAQHDRLQRRSSDRNARMSRKYVTASATGTSHGNEV